MRIFGSVFDQMSLLLKSTLFSRLSSYIFLSFDSRKIGLDLNVLYYGFVVIQKLLITISSTNVSLKVQFNVRIELLIIKKLGKA